MSRERTAIATYRCCHRILRRVWPHHREGETIKFDLQDTAQICWPRYQTVPAEPFEGAFGQLFGLVADYYRMVLSGESPDSHLRPKDYERGCGDCYFSPLIYARLMLGPVRKIWGQTLIF